MGSTKHEKTFVDFEKPYEHNFIGLKGIIYFGVGLLALILITFVLMYVLLWNVFEADAVASKASSNPLQLSDRDRLPPEPRLQAAPGFEVRGPDGTVNLELTEPQAEYRELQKIWDKQLKEGQVHPETGAVIAMPIDQAIDLMVQRQAGAAQTAPAGANTFESSKMYITDASAGRKAGQKRR